MSLDNLYLVIGQRRRRSWLRDVGEIAREHWILTALLLVGATIRVLAMVAYTPALFFPDSWGYISVAFSKSSTIGLPGLRPVGYSVLIRLLTLPGRDMSQIVAFQHLSGLIVGVVIYEVLLRFRLPRWAAAAAAALVLLDGYAITLEQYVMADTFFTAMLLATIVFLAWPALVSDDRTLGHVPTLISPRRAAVAGLLLALTTLEREAAIFVVPVLVIYLFWTRSGWNAVLALIVTAAIPLVGYAALVNHKYHVFGITAASGWVSYGRVAGFANCKGAGIQQAARPLCETAAERRTHPTGPTWYIWGPSPARRLFHPNTASIAESARANSILQTFSQKILLHQPLDFASAMFGDLLKYFTPNATALDNAVSATSLPTKASAEAKNRNVQQRDLPGMHPSIQSPAPLVRAYRGVIHVPRPVLAVLALGALVAIVMGLPARREMFLIAGSGIILLLGTAATAGFGLRYLMPAVPLLAIGGALALAQLRSNFR